MIGRKISDQTITCKVIKPIQTNTTNLTFYSQKINHIQIREHKKASFHQQQQPSQSKEARVFGLTNNNVEVNFGLEFQLENQFNRLNYFKQDETEYPTKQEKTVSSRNVTHFFINHKDKSLNVQPKKATSTKNIISLSTKNNISLNQQQKNSIETTKTTDQSSKVTAREIKNTQFQMKRDFQISQTEPNQKIMNTNIHIINGNINKKILKNKSILAEKNSTKNLKSQSSFSKSQQTNQVQDKKRSTHKKILNKNITQLRQPSKQKKQQLDNNQQQQMSLRAWDETYEGASVDIQTYDIDHPSYESVKKEEQITAPYQITFPKQNKQTNTKQSNTKQSEPMKKKFQRPKVQLRQSQSQKKFMSAKEELEQKHKQKKERLRLQFEKKQRSQQNLLLNKQTKQQDSNTHEESDIDGSCEESQRRDIPEPIREIQNMHQLNLNSDPLEREANNDQQEREACNDKHEHHNKQEENFSRQQKGKVFVKEQLNAQKNFEAGWGQTYNYIESSEDQDQEVNIKQDYRQQKPQQYEDYQSSMKTQQLDGEQRGPQNSEYARSVEEDKVRREDGQNGGCCEGQSSQQEEEDENPKLQEYLKKRNLISSQRNKQSQQTDPYARTYSCHNPQDQPKTKQLINNYIPTSLAEVIIEVDEEYLQSSIILKDPLQPEHQQSYLQQQHQQSHETLYQESQLQSSQGIQQQIQFCDSSDSQQNSQIKATNPPPFVNSRIQESEQPNNKSSYDQLFELNLQSLLNKKFIHIAK